MMARAVLCAAGLVVLSAFAASSVGADGANGQVVVWSGTRTCGQYISETLSGVVTACLPAPESGIRFAAAADSSLVVESDTGYLGESGPIWLVRPNGATVEVDSSPYDFDPDISPDGSKITFARLDPTTWGSDIYVVNADGSGLSLVAGGIAANNRLGHPVFSPDGGSIAYWCEPAFPPVAGPPPTGAACGPLPDGSYTERGAMLMNTDGSDKRMILIGLAGRPSTLSWSTDGEWLTMDDGGSSACSGSSQCPTQVFVYRTDGSDLFDFAAPSRQVTHVSGQFGAVEPRFCGDDQQILYANADDGSLHLVYPDGSNDHQIALSSEGQPSFNIACIPSGIGQGPPPTVDAMRVTVPSVRALSYAKATRRLAAAHLTVGKVLRRFSPRVSRNHVIAQSPRAGTKDPRTTTEGPPVLLVLSLGRRRHESPPRREASARPSR